MLTARNKERATFRKARKVVSLNVLLSGYDPAREIACRATKLTYMCHKSDCGGKDLYTIVRPTAMSKSPSLTGPGVFGAGGPHSQRKASGAAL